MNRITNVSIKDNVMSFNIISNISIVNTDELVVYIDECTNIDSIYCDNPDDHNYIFYYDNSKFTLREIVEEGDLKEVTTEYKYEITITSDIILQLDHNIKYIKVFVTTERYANDYADGVYYNPDVLYNAEIGKLHKHCSTCLDDKLMQLIILVVFKRQLLEQAIITNHNKEALQFYLDLSKLLDVNINSSINGNCCKKCVNGMCEL